MSSGQQYHNYHIAKIIKTFFQLDRDVDRAAEQQQQQGEGEAAGNLELGGLEGA